MNEDRDTLFGVFYLLQYRYHFDLMNYSLAVSYYNRAAKKLGFNPMDVYIIIEVQGELA